MSRYRYSRTFVLPSTVNSSNCLFLANNASTHLREEGLSNTVVFTKGPATDDIDLSARALRYASTTVTTASVTSHHREDLERLRNCWSVCRCCSEGRNLHRLFWLSRSWPQICTGYTIGSLSKTMVAQEIGALVEEGSLSWDSAFVAGTSPKVLESYCGRCYRVSHCYFIDVVLCGDILQLSIQGRRDQSYDLEHYHYDTFAWLMDDEEEHKRRSSEPKTPFPRGEKVVDGTYPAK